ncbi:2',3'-cyclic-nucleotide 3'-phosphodiesterase [Flammula alnicola]|nr:2',3'-cyclic-nucleotide 3'-phosphodiesterase [Flammula alnicola]
MGLSIWIVPDKDSDKIETVMKIRQNSYKSSLTKESYPKFHPHITLASLPLSMENALDTIGASIPKLGTPLRCSFASVDIGSHYYRSVYVAIKLTSELISLHKHVHEVLDVEPRTPAFPHMSLCYIDDDDAAKGERNVYYEALKDGGKLWIEGEGSGDPAVSLNCGSPGKDDWIGHFDAHEVWAVRCEGPVEGWAVLRKLPFPQL